MKYFIRVGGAARLADRKKDANFSFEIIIFCRGFILEYRTRERITFVNTTGIAYRQNHEAPADFSRMQ